MSKKVKSRRERRRYKTWFESENVIPILPNNNPKLPDVVIDFKTRAENVEMLKSLGL